MSVKPTVLIELQKEDLSWLNLTPDVRSVEGLTLHYGIQSNTPDILCAESGELAVAMRNDAGNSGGIQGWYSPLHASKRAEWAFARPIRVTFSFDGNDYVKFYGKVRVIDPEAGRQGPRRVFVSAYDGMRDLVRADARTITAQLNQDESTLLDALLDAVPASAQPIARDFDLGVDTLAWAFDDLSADSKVISVIANLMRSVVGRYFQKGDGTHCYRNRHTIGTGASLGTLDDDALVDLAVPSDADRTYSGVRVTIDPRTPGDTDTEVLYAITGPPPSIQPGASFVVWGEYVDPVNGTEAIGGTDQQPLAAGTDYAGNSAADGSGTVLTGFLVAVVAAFSANVRFEITNTSTQVAYLCGVDGVAKLQVRGRAVRRLTEQTLESIDEAAVDETPFKFHMTYQSSPHVAQSAADYIRRVYGGAKVDAVTFCANESPTLMALALAREPGDRITLSETVTGVASLDAVIQSVALSYDRSRRLLCTWGLAPANTLVSWQWGIDGASNWGESTVFGF